MADFRAFRGFCACDAGFRVSGFGLRFYTFYMFYTAKTAALNLCRASATLAPIFVCFVYFVV